MLPVMTIYSKDLKSAFYVTMWYVSAEPNIY